MQLPAPSLTRADRSSNAPDTDTHDANSLLIACVKVYLGTYSPEKLVASIKANTDWETILGIAQDHGIVPILYHTLQAHCTDRTPQNILGYLKKFSRKIAQRNLALTVELINLLKWLGDHDIPAVPFKGPLLAVSAYGEYSLRQFVDLDILIHKKDAGKIRRLMLAEGYEQLSHVSVNDAHENLYLQAACEYNFFRADRNVAVEPHWGFAQAKLCISFDPEQLWKRLQEVSILGKALPVFGPEDTLLIVCINGMKDHWFNFKTICDVAALICSCQIDWEVLLKRARRVGCQRILFVGLSLAYVTLSAPIPEYVLKQVQSDSMTQSLTFQVQSRLFEKVNKRTRGHAGGNFSIWDLQMRERKRDKLRYLFNLVFSPNEGDASIILLPSFLYWLYPYIRPLRLMRRFISGINQRATIR